MGLTPIDLLLVEDNPGDARLIARLLKTIDGREFRVVSVETLADAMSKIEQDTFDVALLDLSLPDSMGVATVESVSAVAPYLPIIVLTGQRDDALGQSLVSAGAQDYLSKSALDRSTLFRALLHAIERGALKRELMLSHENMEAFISAASHDLVAPLNRIGQMLEMLANDLDGNIGPDGKQLLDVMQGQTRNMRGLLDSMLVQARLRSELPDFEAFDLREAIDGAVENLNGTISESKAEIRIGPMPIVVGAKNDVIRIFQNLLGNSLKYVRDVAPRIEIEATEGEGTAKIEIQDNGIGIESAYQPRMFEPFQRFVATSEFEGSGLGLSICRELVERNRGRIWAESDGLEEGTRIILEWPLGEKR